MSPYYYQELPTNIMDDETAMLVAVMMLGILGVVLLFALAFWIIRSMSLHAIAKRRGIRHAWLAWIPIGSEWILGSVSDQYQHLTQSKLTSRRKIMLCLELSAFVVAAVSGTMSVLAVLRDAGAMEVTPGMMLLSMIPSLLTTVVGITTLVFYHVCNYDLYRSCDPKNAVAYLVIGIIFPVTEPFFYLVNRKKDRGFVSNEIPETKPEF